MPDWIIAPATPDDVPGIMATIDESFPPTWRSLLIYGSRGASQYASAVIRRQNHGGDVGFLVARSGEGRVLGFAEMRRLAGSLHLNNLATTAEARGQGIYTRLMAEALRHARSVGYARVSCDVFVDNPIRTFLLKVGYRATGARTWQAAPLPAGPLPAGVYFAGLPQADAVHREFGFSQVQVLTARGACYEAGRLGQRWFRVSDPTIVADRDVLVALHHLDPGRELLAAVPVTVSLPDGLEFREVVVSERLEADIDALLPALAGRSAR